MLFHLTIHSVEIFNITNGEIKYSCIKEINGKRGYEKLYLYKKQYYFISGIGINGFIISIYPKNDNEALKLIRRYS